MTLSSTPDPIHPRSRSARPAALDVPNARPEPAQELPRPGHLLALWQAAVLATLPDGGQRAARRNAWASMSADSARGRARREAQLAVDAAQARSRPMVSGRSG